MLDIPNLELCAKRIDAALTRIEHGAREWIEGTLELADELAGARSYFPGNSEFSRWLEARFSDRAPKKDERAILIQWGRDLAQARALLEQTESRSIRIIHQAFRVLTVANSEGASAQEKPPELPIPDLAAEQKQRERAERDARERADRQRLSDQQRDQRLRQIAEKERLKQEAAAAREQTRRTEEAARKQRYEEELARETARFNASQEQYRQASKAADFDPLKYVSDLLRPNRGYPLTVEEFRIIVRAAHPDNSASEDMRTRALAILNSKKEDLTGVK